MHGGYTTNPDQPVWAAGWLDWNLRPDNTNTILLTDPRYSILARYCGKDARLFKCPADPYLSPAQRARGWKERVRSISQNLYAANGNVESGPTDFAYAHVTKLTELVNPKPAETWVSIDEHPDSINDEGFFAPGVQSWIDLPANYHDGGAGVAFADGRSEIHRWQASLLKVPIKYSFSAPPVTASDPDLRWLRHHTPRKPGAN
jgi:prepilin-type processing-associated H-X9-DG protein